MKMTNKVLVLLLCLLLLGCSNTKPSATTQNDDRITVESDNSDPLIVAQKLMVNYLDQFKTENVSVDQRLKAYSINDIKIYSQNTSGFVFTANYSVQYIEEFSGAGNGTISKDGWVLNKYQFFLVDGKERIFTIRDITTAPPNNS